MTGPIQTPTGPTPPPGHDLTLYAMPGHLIRRLQQVAVSLFVNTMRGIGQDLTPVQFAALRGISHHPGIDQAALAGLIAYDRATIGGVIDRLEAKSLVRRMASPSDRRVRQLMLQPDGRALLARVDGPVGDIQAAILEPLTTEERATFLRLLTRLVAEHNENSRAPLRPIEAPGPGLPGA